MKPISEMNRFEIDDLEKEIRARKMQLMAEAVTARGIHATSIIHGHPSEYILVYSPNLGEFSNAWATVDECRRLLDTLANLPPAEAYRRWYPKVEDKYPSSPYTHADAIRDTREARKALTEDYASGKISGRDYAELHATTNFMDLV